MKRRALVAQAFLAWALAFGLACEAGAQENLRACLERGGPIPACSGLSLGGLTDLDCNRNYRFYSGRVGWYPLRCVGPITIEINARAEINNRYPLYVEIVPAPPYPGPPGYSPCNGPGYVVMTARGGYDCDPWESIGPIDITNVVPLGSTYAVQVVFFDTRDGDLVSPAMDCIHVTAHPTRSALGMASWGHVKRLYR